MSGKQPLGAAASPSLDPARPPAIHTNTHHDPFSDTTTMTTRSSLQVKGLGSTTGTNSPGQQSLSSTITGGGGRRGSGDPLTLDMPSATSLPPAMIQVAAQPPQSGNASHTFPDGSFYDGEWQHGVPHGRGSCVYTGSQNVYVGSWVHGKCDGEGLLVYGDTGDLYNGHWTKGACDGDGTFVANGTITTGTWSQGSLVVTKSKEKMGSGSNAMNAKAMQIMATALSRAATATTTSNAALHALPQNLSRRGTVHLTVGGAAGQRNSPKVSPTSPALELTSTPLPSTSLALDGPEAPQPTVRRRARASTFLGGNTPAGPTGVGVSQGDASPFQPNLPVAAGDVAMVESGPVAPRGPLEGEGGGDGPSTNTEHHPAVLGSAENKPQALREVLFAAAGPAYNTSFDLQRYLKFFLIFLVPFFSLPHIRCCPGRISFLEIEREYVVSGAALRIDFEPPKTALYVAALSVVFAWVTVILADAANETIGSKGHLSMADVIIPLTLVVVFAAMNAGYHSYRRVAHALERFDRHLYPKIASFAANAIDSVSPVCIYTWDEDGNSRVTNTHYSWRWAAIAAVSSFFVSFSTPVLRAILGEQAFGNTTVERAGMALAFLSLFCTTCGITYYVLKITDMQRQVLSQMVTLSKLAFMNGCSIARPTYFPRVKFDLDAPVDPKNIFEGFVGWYVSRCFILYSSLCANHAARAASMSAFASLMIVTYIMAIADAIYSASIGASTDTGGYYNPAHLLGLIASLFWGTLLTRYIYICNLTDRERNTHLYLGDVAALYHQSVLSDAHAAGVVHLCRSMLGMHDHRPELLGFRVRRSMLVSFVVLQLGALAGLIMQIVQLARFGRH